MFNLLEIAKGDCALILNEVIRASLLNANPRIANKDLEKRTQTICADAILLARCAKTKYLISYSSATALRGRGIAQDGRWLDDVYYHAIAPLGFPDLTLLVVSKNTPLPSSRIFEAGYTKLSNIAESEVPLEQQRCVWFEGYEDVLGPLEPIPEVYQFRRVEVSPSPIEREISRAVTNAICRVAKFGVKQTSLGKEYPNSASRAELMPLVRKLLEQQNGRCALTGQAFDQRSIEEGGGHKTIECQ